MPSKQTGSIAIKKKGGKGGERPFAAFESLVAISQQSGH
jgi:hypothetical protein